MSVYETFKTGRILFIMSFVMHTLSFLAFIFPTIFQNVLPCYVCASRISFGIGTGVGFFALLFALFGLLFMRSLTKK